MAKSGIDDGEIWVNPKKNPATAPTKPSPPVVGGAEELPGSPRPAKPGRSSLPSESDAEFRRQTPGRVDEDAEVWDGSKWVYPSGGTVEGQAVPGKSDNLEPSVHEDEDTEITTTPRKAAAPPDATRPLFSDAKAAAGQPQRGHDGQDFDEYVRPLTPDPASPTFALGGFVPQAPAAKAPANAAPPALDVPKASPKLVHSTALPTGALNVLLIGSGAREHAMALAIRRSQRAHLFVVTRHRNPGLVKSATGFKLLDERDAAGIVAWAKLQKIQLAVTGPESALEAGVTDALRAAGIAVASPSQAAARIETSKTFMRDLMERHQVPGRLAAHAFTSLRDALAFLDKNGPVWALKPVGLTGGKGVQVHGDHFTDVDGAKAYVRSVFEGNVGGGAIQFEELARGEEYTVMAFTDGTTVLPMPAVQDHKRLLEGDKGPNTGGMGSYACADGVLPFLRRPEYDESVRILQGLVDGLRADGTPYVGTIYGQFMLTTSGPKVIEVNARFGDPEAMNVLHTLESDYLSLLEAMATGTLAGKAARFRPAATVVKYVVPLGYGDGKPTPHHLEVDTFGLKRVGGAAYFGSIEQSPAGTLSTMTSRAIGVLGEGATLEQANAVCEASLKHIHGEGLFVRHDIGSADLIRQRVAHMNKIRGPASQDIQTKVL